MLSIGKYRGLQQCSTAHRGIAILALDHRNNLRNSLRPAAPETVSAQELTAFKTETVSALSSAASAVLLDPEVGAGQCIASGALPGQTGLVVAVEATGYSGDPAARESRLLPGWSVAKSRQMGASAVKLLVYYHPDSRVAGEIEALVCRVGQECLRADLLFCLEPLSYSLDASVKKLAPGERRRVVLETARRLTAIAGVDLLKAEFPLDVKSEPDERDWGAACAELTAASRVPWVLLSASVDYPVFLRQAAIACQNGATGVAVGRAVWQEACALEGAQRARFLKEIACPRMERLTGLCDALGRDWAEIYPSPAVDAGWYGTYGASAEG